MAEKRRTSSMDVHMPIWHWSIGKFSNDRLDSFGALLILMATDQGQLKNQMANQIITMYV